MRIVKPIRDELVRAVPGLPTETATLFRTIIMRRGVGDAGGEMTYDVFSVLPTPFTLPSGEKGTHASLSMWPTSSTDGV